MSNEPVFEIVSPVGDSVETKAATAATPARIASAAPLDDLSGKTVGFIWTKFRNGDILLDAFADLLSQRYQGMSFVKLPSGTALPYGDYPDATFADVVREYRVDAVIAAPAC